MTSKCISLYINSADSEKVNGDYGSHIIYRIQGSMSMLNFYSASVRLDNVSIPLSFYQCDDRHNSFTFQYLNSNEIIVKIPEGNYDYQSLMVIMNGMLNKYNLLVSYNEISLKYIFTSTQNEFTIKQDTINNILGINSEITSNNKIIESQFMVNFSGTQCISIMTNLNVENYDTTGGKSNVLDRIVSTDYMYNQILYYNNNDTNNKYLISNTSIDYLEIKLYDDNNELLDLNGRNFNMKLSFYLTQKPIALPNNGYLGIKNVNQTEEEDDGYDTEPN